MVSDFVYVKEGFVRALSRCKCWWIFEINPRLYNRYSHVYVLDCYINVYQCKVVLSFKLI